MTTPAMILEAKKLSKTYVQGDSAIHVLNDLNLEVREKELLAVVGPSGSGKSTFLSLISGLDRPTSGDVYVRGQSLNALDQKGLTHFRAQHIGIVFQQFHLLQNLTALENVMLPLQLFKQPGAKAKAQELLEQVGLAHRQKHFPSQLSGGENQRVAIARALVVKPDILLADEPSGNLDVEMGEQVMDLLFRLVRERRGTLLLVTHNPELARRCDRQLKLQGGRFL